MSPHTLVWTKRPEWVDVSHKDARDEMSTRGWRAAQVVDKRSILLFHCFRLRPSAKSQCTGSEALHHLTWALVLNAYRPFIFNSQAPTQIGTRRVHCHFLGRFHTGVAADRLQKSQLELKIVFQLPILSVCAD